MVKDARGPYNKPSAGNEVDEMTYNSQADARSDHAAFDDCTDPETQPIGARGADNQPTNRNYLQEDQETERSEETGRISSGEVDDLLSSQTAEERDATGGTRGKRVDAFKQERDLDRAYEESGVYDDQKDVEIRSATGRH
ncbi:uncharacterized protein BXZ73DRAFT_96288 [Epithele typhae]|uniref:uncharacterized protein n=1 Tax=Epithele typhae TaxID=378194 RepID=UPI002007EAEB|nr:uncharacterized protein BXZ73DRAFT_96288 [Epithele typhae]KAH9945302.1 hypothetical protein BXZ73DRAFT_96288 [Epithele typhae]